MSLSIDLNGKVAVVTGASRGIGKALAIGLSYAGADIAVASRSLNSLQATCNEIKKNQRKCLAIQVDVSKRQDVKNLFDKVLNVFQKIDILVNAAGITVRKPFLEISEEEWDFVLDVNLKGIYLCCKEALKHMMANHYGKIVNIASTASLLGIRNIAPYCASKGGVMQITKALAVEYGDYNINVNAVAPGYIETDLVKDLLKDKKNVERILKRTPVKRFGEPNDLVGLVAFLASDLSSFITGQIIFIDGGFAICGS